MTVASRPTEVEPPPARGDPQPLVQSVRSFLERKPSTPTVPSPLRGHNACHADIAPSTETLQGDIRGINFEPLARHDLNNNPPQTSAPAPAMPSQAELMQRQPLLARSNKEPLPNTDSSEGEHSPQRGDFVVDIPNVGRDERYPKEVCKTIMAFVFLFLCVCINMTALSLVHERVPDQETTPPLGDIVLDNVAPRYWGLPASEYIIMISTTIAMVVVVFHKHRFIVARRLFFITGLLYLYRSVTMFVTVLPVPSKDYYCSPKSEQLTPLILLERVVYLFSGFGLSINGKHTYCGDYIYSGHTMVLVLSYLIVSEYSPRRLWPLHWTVWTLAVLGVSFLMLSHGHYTVDVVIAYYITTRLFWTVHAVLSTNGRTPQMLRREWWFRPLTYLERNVRGPVPRRYDCPLALEWRGKIFSRNS